MVSKSAICVVLGLFAALFAAWPGQAEAAAGGTSLAGFNAASDVIYVGRGFRRGGFARGFHGRSFGHGFRSRGFRGFHGQSFRHGGKFKRGFLGSRGGGFKRFQGGSFKRFNGHGLKGLGGRHFK